DPASSTSRNGWQNGHDVARREGRVEAPGIADVAHVDEQVHMAAYGAGLVADPAIERRMESLQLFEGSAHGQGGERKTGRAAAVFPQRGGNVNLDRRVRCHAGEPTAPR